MTRHDIITRLRRSAEFRFDRATASLRNRGLDAAFARDPGRYLDAIDAALARACAWFAPQPDVSMSVILVGRRSLERGASLRFAFVEEKLDHYRRTLRDPAIRLVDRDYDPDAAVCRDLPDVMDVRPYWPVELLMIDTAWADLRPQPDILDRLRAFDDGGGYGTTHIVVGGLVLLANGGAPEEATRALMASTVETIRAANDRTARAEDIFAERIMALQWLDLHHLVRPAWILRLLRAQREDGGWQARNMPPVGLSNQHTTIVAMAALAEFRAARLRADSVPAA